MDDMQLMSSWNGEGNKCIKESIGLEVVHWETQTKQIANKLPGKRRGGRGKTSRLVGNGFGKSFLSPGACLGDDAVSKSSKERKSTKDSRRATSVGSSAPREMCGGPLFDRL